MLETRILKKIKKLIDREFPEFRGIKPKVVKKSIAPQKSVYKKLSLGVPKEIRTVFNLRFEKMAKTADAVSIRQILIVTTSESGEIIKVSQSK